MLVPPYVRKTASLEAAIPWLYLKGISTGEMQPALEVLVGPEAKGLSASTVARLKQVWREEYAIWRQRRFDADQWVYIWIDGIYSGVRAEQQRLCALVVIGMNVQGEKQLLAMEDGIRESTPKLARSPVASENPRTHRPALSHWRWGPRFLGGVGGKSSPAHVTNDVGAIRRRMS